MPMMYPALILAGGLGTRLRSVLAAQPKVLASVAGRPFLSYLLDQLQGAGVQQVILCCGYRADQVEAAFGVRHGTLSLSYSREPTPLGTGGAVRLALPRVQAESVLVLNGDSYLDCPVADLVHWHSDRDFAGSLLLTRVSNAARFGTVAVNETGAISSFQEKRGLPEPGWINAGIYLLSRRLIEQLPEGRPVSLEREAFGQWLNEGLGGYRRQAAFLDIGTPQTLAQAEEFFQGLGTASKEYP
jgi:D-glycero-alpha-D-manno-heptose 1-phosphate guanylyltransferase